VRFVVHLTPEQREALAADAADSGVAMAQIIRDLLDQRYFKEPKKATAGWHITAQVKRRIDPADAPPPARARLREWVSRLGRRR
jgi:hypothetical protein